MTDKTAQRFCAVFLVISVFLVYGQTLNFDYSGMRDVREVATNRMVMAGVSAESVQWVAEGTPGNRWQPLTWLSHLGVRSAGGGLTAHHGLNILLHVVNTLALFLLLQRVTHRTLPSAFVAGVFGLHPLRADAVAWISARGEILGMTFLLLAFFATVGHAKLHRTAGIVLALFLALGAVLSSPRYATAPLLIPLFAMAANTFASEPATERKRWAVAIPFAAIAGFGLSKTGGFELASEASWGELGNRLVALVGAVPVLLGKFVWPHPITQFYEDRPETLFFGIGAVTLAAVAAAARTFRSRAPLLSFGCAWFLIALPPLVTRVNDTSLSISAAETYFVATGLIVGAAGWVFSVAAIRATHGVPRYAAIALLVLFMVASRAQATHWTNTYTLWQYNLAVCPECDMPNRFLGDFYAQRGDIGQAIASYHRAIELNPDEPEHRFALVQLYGTMMNVPYFERELRMLVAKHPDYDPGVTMLAELERRREAR